MQFKRNVRMDRQHAWRVLHVVTGLALCFCADARASVARSSGTTNTIDVVANSAVTAAARSVTSASSPKMCLWKDRPASAKGSGCMVLATGTTLADFIPPIHKSKPRKAAEVSMPEQGRASKWSAQSTRVTAQDAVADPSRVSGLGSEKMCPYLRVSGLYAIPAKRFDTLWVKPAYGLSVGAGYAVNKIFWCDLSVSHRGTFRYTKAPEDMRLANTAFMFTGYITPKLWAEENVAVSPYLLAGAGYAVNKLGNSSTIDNIRITGKNTPALVWQVGAGLRYKLNRVLHIDASYKYVYLNEFIYTTQRIDTLTGTLEPITFAPKDKFAVHEFSLGLVWLMN